MYHFKGFTKKANDALNIAIETAGKLGHTYIGTEHLLLALHKEGSGVAAMVLTECGLDSNILEDKIKETIGVGERISLSPDDFTPRTKRVMQTAVLASAKIGHSFVGTEHLLIAILSEKDSFAVRFLYDAGVNPASVMTALQSSLGEANQQGGFAGENKTSQSPVSNQKSAPSNLLKYGRDLTESAKSGEIDPVVGREEEIARVLQILSRRTKKNCSCRRTRT